MVAAAIRTALAEDVQRRSVAPTTMDEYLGVIRVIEEEKAPEIYDSNGADEGRPTTVSIAPLCGNLPKRASRYAFAAAS